MSDDGSKDTRLDRAIYDIKCCLEWRNPKNLTMKQIRKKVDRAEKAVQRTMDKAGLFREQMYEVMALKRLAKYVLR